ncbi:phosphotransferase [Nocardioides sp. KIGAM211]|uniref:Phosphotransferase n=1 Tax=Nocardioides luti TaxID=2761101 RepID=A0A7X0RJC4_9ACTN|nr:phosphotransferase [Nocardioides luti]MBB6629401.1 phosphotransferase [Nocardioides luti]
MTGAPEGWVGGWIDVGLQLPSASERWRSAGYRDELRAWVARETGEPTSLEPVKVRAWASVWRAVTPGGVHYAKQNCATQPFEAALLAELVRLVPQHVVPLTAVDLDRGLLLTPDQGPVLGEGDLDTWRRVVAAGAALQRALVPHVDGLVAAGVSRLLPADAEEYVAQRLDGFAALPAGDRRALAPDRLAALRAHLPVVRRWAEQVAALGLPATLVHNDLHGNNVFDREDGLRFFDFGDALVMEPLAVLAIPLEMLAARLGAGPDDPRLWRVAEAALEVWSDRAPLAELRAALPAALQLGRLGRTETWLRCTPPMNDEELDSFAGAGAASLAALLDAPVLGHLPG